MEPSAFIKELEEENNKLLGRLEAAEELAVLLLQLFNERARFHRSRLLLH